MLDLLNSWIASLALAMTVWRHSLARNDRRGACNNRLGKPAPDVGYLTVTPSFVTVIGMVKVSLCIMELSWPLAVSDALSSNSPRLWIEPFIDQRLG